MRDKLSIINKAGNAEILLEHLLENAIMNQLTSFNWIQKQIAVMFDQQGQE